MGNVLVCISLVLNEFLYHCYLVEDYACLLDDGCLKIDSLETVKIFAFDREHLQVRMRSR